MRSFLAAMLLFASALVGQRTWVVHCTPGPGVDYPDIPPAVAAAAPGDTILVISDASCTHLRFTAPVIDKPLRLIGAGPFTANIVVGVLEVRNIPAGQQVLLANLQVQIPPFTPPAAPPPPHGIWIHDCQGAVHLQNVATFPYGLVNAIAQFVDCARITLHSCLLYAPGSGSTNSLPPPECSVLFRRCNATIVDSEFRSEIPIPWWNHPLWMTADPLHLEDSDVRLVACTVVGADVIPGPVWSGPRYAVVQNRGTLTIGPATRLTGGQTNLPSMPVNLAVFSRTNGLLVRDPTASLSGGITGCDCPVQVTRTVPAVDLERPIHNRVYRLRVHGAAGSFALLGVANAVQPEIPTPFGNLLLDPRWTAIVAVGQLNAQGFVEFGFHMHPTVPMDVLWAFQAGMIDGNGAAALSLPAPFTVAWETGRPWP